MAGSVKGIIVEIGGDTSALQKALSKVNSATSSLSRELRGVNSLLKLDPKNTELLKQKQDILNKSVEATQNKLEELRKVKEEADKKMAEGTEINEKNYRALQREIANTENKLKQLQLETSNWTKAGTKIDQFGQKIDGVGNKLGKMGMTLTKTVTPAVAGMAALAIKTFDEVDEGADIVIKKTGATADAAVELEEVYENVAGNVAGSFEDVGNAVGEINTRFGFTNKELEEASEKFLKFAKINDIDVNTAVQKVSRYMGDASIESSKYGEVLDDLTSVAQASGISIDALAEMLTKYGAPMRALGLSTKESIAIFAGWEKAGVNTEIAFSGMKKAISNWGKAGKDSSKEFKKTMEEIEKCPNIAKATTKAIEVFGAKAGPDLADAIKGGRFEYTEFLKILENSNGILEETYTNIMDETDEAQVSMKKLKVEFSKIGKEILETAYPAVEDILKEVSELIKKFNNLDPQLKTNILKFTAFGAALGPVVKTGSTLISGVGKGISSAGKLCKTVGEVKSGMDVANNATGLLAKGLAALTTPTGLLAAGATAVAGTLVYLATKETEAQKEARKLSEEMLESKKQLEEYKNGIDKNTIANVSHVESVKKLKNELTKLVDENGKVKDSYKGRVAYILNELNSALGTEYKLNGDIVDSYKNIQKEIDATIEKKKAQFVLEGEEEKARNAQNNQTTAVEKMKEASDKLGMPIEEAKKKVEELGNELEKASNGSAAYALIVSWTTGKEKKRLEDLISAYENAENEVKDYTNTANKYADLYAKYQEGKYNEIAQTITVTVENWTDKTIEQLNTSVSEQSRVLETYKDIYAKTGNEIALQNAEQAQKNIENLATELANRTSTLEQLGQNEIEAWKSIATQSYDVYSMKIAEMPLEMQTKIQEATGIIAAGTPQMQAKAEELGRKTVEEFDKSTDAKTKGLETITGYLKGLSDEDKRELLKQAGIDNVDEIMEQLDRGDLSEENGKNILKGLWNGLKNGSWQGKILGAASGLAQAVNKAFTGKDGWDEHSPSKKMKKFAEYYVQPIEDVMNKRKRGISLTAQGLANKVNSVFDGQMSIPNIQDFSKLQGALKKQVDNSSRITNNDNRNIVFNIKGNNPKEIANEINKIFGSQY